MRPEKQKSDATPRVSSPSFGRACRTSAQSNVHIEYRVSGSIRQQYAAPGATVQRTRTACSTREPGAVGIWHVPIVASVEPSRLANVSFGALENTQQCSTPNDVRRHTTTPARKGVPAGCVHGLLSCPLVSTRVRGSDLLNGYGYPSCRSCRAGRMSRGQPDSHRHRQRRDSGISPQLPALRHLPPKKTSVSRVMGFRR